MKKKIIFVAVAAVIGISAYVGVNSHQKDAMSDIQMANVEALVRGESGENDECHYKNGYTAFTNKGGGAYDCCSIWVAKSPNTDEGHCH